MMFWLVLGSVAISTLQPYQTPAVAPEPRNLQTYTNTAVAPVSATCPLGCTAVSKVYGWESTDGTTHCQCGVTALLPTLLALEATALILYVFLPTIIFLVFAILYKGRVTDRRPQWNGAAILGGGDFQPGIFGCFDDLNTCLHATFCWVCRAADTYQAVNLMWYWTTVLVFVAIDALSTFICPIISAFLIRSLPVYDPERQKYVQDLVSLLPMLALGIAFTQKRRQLRQVLGGSPVAPGYCMDFLLWSFCPCCVIAQEAKNVDKAQGVQVNCCCDLVGAPMNYDALQMQQVLQQQQLQQQMMMAQQQMAVNQKTDDGICGC